MTALSRSLLAASIAALLFTLVFTLASYGQQLRFRYHTDTVANGLVPIEASIAFSGNVTEITVDGDTRIITTNAVPTHSVGDFSTGPNQVSAQDDVYTVDATPEMTDVSDLRLAQLFGVAVNGIAFDPLAAEFWQGDMQSGWQYEALAGAIDLQLDENYGHVQPDGSYHYHGLPIGLLQELGWSASEASPLVGYAADGFPIYALTAEVDGTVQMLQSSYQLQDGERPGGDAPDGAYDGAFVQDYVFVEGSGDLDACNGTWLVTDEYPEGTYAYVLTAEFPVIPRCLSGDADASFLPGRA